MRWLAPLIAVWTVAAAVAQEGGGDAPPEQLPPGAQLASSPVVFTEVDVGFTTADLALPTFDLAPAPVADLGVPTTGLSVREEEGGRLRFTLGADILFDFDRDDLRPEADPVLRKLLQQVQERVPRARWQVEGHTDAKGSDAYNDTLSNRRANSVRRWLTERGGVPGADIATSGIGERRPVAPNQRPDGSDDPDGRQLNRRVEILVTPL